MHPDNKYIEALKQHASPLIAEIYDRYAAKIERMVTANNGTASDAADIFQEALTDLYHKAHAGFVLTCPLDAFLYLICKNKWLNQLAKQKRSPVTFTDVGGYSASEDVFQNTERLYTMDARMQALQAAFDKLGESCRRLLSLCWKGMPLEEVATQMATTYGYIRKKKSECTGKLTELVKNSPDYHSLSS